MKVSDIVRELGLEVYAGGECLDTEVTGGYTSDLLSDVMGHASEGDVWITLQAHKNIVAIASLKELPAIILVKGFRPEQDTLELALQEGVALLGTSAEEFETSGRLYALLGK